ncbi:MAG TPA: DciA family protein, partial [Mycobacteriales bacterium]|nr:DciA family protein [Mycobacteriales bacterium]
PPPGSAPRGPDLARAALARAKAAARDKGVASRRSNPVRRLPAGPRAERDGDARDPVAFGAAIRRLVADKGWQDTAVAAGVLANWDQLVGEQLAGHCRPESLLAGKLVLVAESSAWATQVRLLAPTLLATLAGQVGAGVVTSIEVRGPTQPDWRKGPRRVRGRGPRDTYG